MSVAAVTMVWNESHFLPIWKRYYSKEVGLDNCFVIDHGSSDRCVEESGLKACLRLERTPLDEFKRAEIVTSVCEGLLHQYDTVIYTDVDEILVPDPRFARNLIEFATLSKSPVVTAIGLNVMHSINEENEIDTNNLITRQRSSIWFVAPMCKPLMIKTPVNWTPGFHSCDKEIIFEPLFNFHLRMYDLNQGLIRLKKTREMERALPGINAHQAIPDEQWRNDFKFGVSARQRREDVDLDMHQSPLKDYLQSIVNGQVARADDMYKLDLGLLGSERWRLPERFIGRF